MTSGKKQISIRDLLFNMYMEIANMNLDNSKLRLEIDK